MPQDSQSTVVLPFSAKYDQQHSHAYFTKHRDGLARRLSNWRDMQVARKALKIAGEPNLVLDLPCGAGRFWPMLAERTQRVIIGADNSAEMLKVARSLQLEEVVARVQTMQTSAFNIDLPANAVECVFCMRLLHHVGDAEHRETLLREMNRVATQTVIISLWVDGNLKAWRRKRLENDRGRREHRDYQNRFVLPVNQVEQEFANSGFDIEARLDFLPRYAMWRTYVLRKRTA